MKKLIVVASKDEAELILDKKIYKNTFVVKGYQVWKMNSGDFFAVLGIAKVTFAIGTQCLIDVLEPNVVISLGFAGAIDKELDILDEIIVTETYQYDIVSSKIASKHNDDVEVRRLKHFYIYDNVLRHLEMSDEFRGMRQAIMATGDNFLENSCGIFKDTMNLAVDQETCAFYQSCYYNEVPYITIKIITDYCDRESRELYKKNLGKAQRKLVEIFEKVLRLDDEVICTWE